MADARDLHRQLMEYDQRRREEARIRAGGTVRGILGGMAGMSPAQIAANEARITARRQGTTLTEAERYARRKELMGLKQKYASDLASLQGKLQDTNAKLIEGKISKSEAISDLQGEIIKKSIDGLIKLQERYAMEQNDIQVKNLEAQLSRLKALDPTRIKGNPEEALSDEAKRRLVLADKDHKRWLASAEGKAALAEGDTEAVRTAYLRTAASAINGDIFGGEYVRGEEGSGAVFGEKAEVLGALDPKEAHTFLKAMDARNQFTPGVTETQVKINTMLTSLSDEDVARIKEGNTEDIAANVSPAFIGALPGGIGAQGDAAGEIINLMGILAMGESMKVDEANNAAALIKNEIEPALKDAQWAGMPGAKQSITIANSLMSGMDQLLGPDGLNYITAMSEAEGLAGVALPEMQEFEHPKYLTDEMGKIEIMLKELEENPEAPAVRDLKKQIMSSDDFKSLINKKAEEVYAFMDEQGSLPPGITEASQLVHTIDTEDLWKERLGKARQDARVTRQAQRKMRLKEDWYNLTGLGGPKPVATPPSPAEQAKLRREKLIAQANVGAEGSDVAKGIKVGGTPIALRKPPVAGEEGKGAQPQVGRIMPELSPKKKKLLEGFEG